MKKLVLITTAALMLTSLQASAFDFSSDCDPTTGDISVVIKSSSWDVFYHKNVTIKVRGSDMKWKEVSYPLAAPGRTFSANAYSMGLEDVEYYNITTDTTTLVVSACGS